MNVSDNGCMSCLVRLMALHWRIVHHQMGHCHRVPIKALEQLLQYNTGVVLGL